MALFAVKTLIVVRGTANALALTEQGFRRVVGSTVEGIESFSTPAQEK